MKKNTKRILVADESPVIRMIIRKELLEEDYEIFNVENGEEALERIVSVKPHLITIASDMPGMSGFEVCRQIRASEAKSSGGYISKDPLPVIFITGDDTIEGREKGFEAGATDFLAKPFKNGKLREIVNNILHPSPIWLGITALVAEDGVMTRKIVVNALGRLGIDVLEARDGAAALKIARANKGKIDMVVSDYRMPKMNGDELCRKLRKDEAFADVPVIIMSAKGEKSAILNLFRAGATDYLIKPFSIEELLARVKVHLKACLLTRDLKNKNHEMEEDLDLARSVQMATLHKKAHISHVRNHVYWHPHGQVSGDVYDFAVNRENAFCAFLGDATGHGVGAAFLTMMVQIGLDSIGADAPVDEILDHIHRLIFERSGERFVTGIYTRLSADGELTFSSAGHPPLIVIPRQGEPRVFSESGGMPLGIMEEPLPFGVDSCRLSPGDKYFIYSDGLMEWANPDEEQYGLDRLISFLLKGRGKSIEENVDGLEAELKKFAQGTVCGDDVTFIGLQYEKPAEG